MNPKEHLKNRVEIIDKLKNYLDSMSTKDSSKGWIIIYKGSQLILKSKKSIWSTRRHAVCALAHELSYRLDYEDKKYLHDSYGESSIVRVLEKLNIIEFKELN